MAQPALTEEQRKGVRASIIAIMLILVLFVLVLLSGDPIMYFGTEPPSVAYTVVVYLPVIALCAIAYRRVSRR